MATIQPKTWEGNFRLVEQGEEGSNCFALKPSPTGKYSAENLQDAIKALLSTKAVLIGWNVWIDGDFDVKHETGKPLPASTLAKLVKQAEHIDLVFVKRPWPQPKIKFTIGGGTGPVSRASKKAPREL
jgi:hypothetical protein